MYRAKVGDKNTKKCWWEEFNSFAKARTFYLRCKKSTHMIILESECDSEELREQIEK